MRGDIHVQHPCAVAEDIYGLPGAAFSKKSLMQHAACQSAGEVTGDVFSDGLTYAGAHVRKPLAIHVWAGNQGKQPCEEKLMR